MTDVLFRADYPDGTPRRYQVVTVTLVHGGAGGSTGGRVVGDTVRVRLDGDGNATAALAPNADITPEGTYYQCTMSGAQPSVTRYIEVPDAGPVSWSDPAIQVAAPEPPGFAELVASPLHRGGVGVRHSLPNWPTALDAATAAAPIDVVMITDSLWETTATGGPSAGQLLHRALNAAAGVYGADPTGTSTLPLPVHAQGSGPTATSTQGTASTTATGGQGSTLTDAQVLTHVATATGFSIAYRTEPGWGTLTIRDGAGGTVLATIDCDDSAASGHLWTSGTLSDASHTLHITSTGTTRVELIMPTRGTRVRVWPCGRVGATTDDYLDNPAQALDFIDTLDAAGTLALVVVCTGTNDDGEYADVPALVDLVAEHTSADRLLWLPYMSAALAQAEYDAALPLARSAGVPWLDASVVADQIGTLDGTHPNSQGRAVMAAHVAAVLSGDPIGAAIRLGGALTAGRGASSTQLQESGLAMGGGDTYVLRTAAATIGVGTGLGLLLGVPDGVVGLAAAQVTEGSDPAAAAASKVKVYAKNDGGRSRLYTRDDVGVRSVAFVDDITAFVDDITAFVDDITAAWADLDAADVGAAPTSRTISAGTGLTGGGDLSANRTLAVSYGTTAGTAAQGNDSRLSDARTPTSHVHGAADISSGTVATARLGSGTASSATFLRGDQTWGRPGLILPAQSGQYHGLQTRGANATYHFMITITGRMALVPVFVEPGSYDALALNQTVVGTSTWRFGLYPSDPTTLIPDGLALIADLGTLDMSTTTGYRTVAASVSPTVPTLYWAGVLLDALTTAPTVHCVGGGGGAFLVDPPWTPNTMGSNITRNNITRIATGVTTGAMPATCPATSWSDFGPWLALRGA